MLSTLLRVVVLAALLGSAASAEYSPFTRVACPAINERIKAYEATPQIKAYEATPQESWIMNIFSATGDRLEEPTNKCDREDCCPSPWYIPGVQYSIDEDVAHISGQAPVYTEYEIGELKWYAENYPPTETWSIEKDFWRRALSTLKIIPEIPRYWYCGGSASSTWQSAFDQFALQVVDMAPFVLDLMVAGVLKLPAKAFNMVAGFGGQLPDATFAKGFEIAMNLPDDTYAELATKVMAINDDTFSNVALKLAKLPWPVLQDFADKSALVLPETQFNLLYEKVSLLLEDPDFDSEAKAVLAELATVAGFGD